jgi:addiction module HigA family antidote
MLLTAIHPGEHLAEELNELGISAAELARRLDVPTNRITGILNGQRAVTGDTALRLGHFFGTSPQFWLNLQSLYELRIAQSRAGKSIKALPRLTHYERSRGGSEEWQVDHIRQGLRESQSGKFASQRNVRKVTDRLRRK